MDVTDSRERKVRMNGALSHSQTLYALPMPKAHTDVVIRDRLFRVTLQWTAAYAPDVIAVEVKALRDTAYRRGTIDAALLREVPLGKIIAAQRPTPDPSTVWVKPRTGRPPVLGVEHYQEVARVYRDALTAGDKPVQAVADEFKVNETTARRWVHVARHRHRLLAPVRPGQAG
ncbi:MAG TPA: hypothetical protein VGS97_25120 [Actinocrinis sp.]|nr:hypothetical protein [Actinocrinis sp.]